MSDRQRGGVWPVPQGFVLCHCCGGPCDWHKVHPVDDRDLRPATEDDIRAWNGEIYPFYINDGEPPPFKVGDIYAFEPPCWGCCVAACRGCSSTGFVAAEKARENAYANLKRVIEGHDKTVARLNARIRACDTALSEAEKQR